MKFAVIADIHGNYPALRRVLDKIDELNITHIISLGDIAGYYSMVNECIDALRHRNITNIMGNHDKYIAFDTECPRSHSANRCLNYQKSVITETNKTWLTQSTQNLTLWDERISLVHGGWNDPVDEYMLKPSSSYFNQFKAQYFFSGHVHVQCIATLGRKTYCNPGSVGQPRDGNPHSAFAVFDHGDITLHRVAYSIETIAKHMTKAGFEPYFYENLYNGTRIGGALSTITPE